MSQTAGRSYEPTWESLDARPTPAWYRDAKFGIFIHWGVYSVPAFAPVGVKGQNPFAEWYWHSLVEGKNADPQGAGASTLAFHRRVYGPTTPYFDFAPRFTAELFDAEQWAEVFARSGAKYVVTTSKHHDGFALWKSEHANRTWGRPWNSVDIGPRRDLLHEISTAVRRRGLKAGLYYSLLEWYNPLWLEDRRRYLAEHMHPQFKDAVEHTEPSIIFADGEWELTGIKWGTPDLLAWLFNDSPVGHEVVINDRWGKDTRHLHGGYFTTEYASGLASGSHAWEECRGMGLSFGYNRMETAKDYQTQRQLILTLIDVVSRGGNLLLDIGPAADGTIPVVMEERLRAIGAWLSVYGEAIYGTHGGKIARQWSAGTVPDVKEAKFMSGFSITQIVDQPAAGGARVDAFFTAKSDVIYAFLPRWPGPTLTLNGIVTRPGANVVLLHANQTLAFADLNGKLEIAIPAAVQALSGAQVAYVIKFEGATFA